MTPKTVKSVKPPKSASNNRRISSGSVGLTPSEVEKQLIKAPVGKAEEAIGTLKKGCNILGITKGQFSMLDLLRACLDQTGPADVMLSTWTFGVRDAEMAAWLVTAGVIRKFRFLVDHSFPQREVKYCKRLRELFGDECIVLSKVHAKFSTLRNEKWNLCITGSMNLNRNPRWEHFTLWDDPAACDFLDSIEAELRKITGARWDVKESEVSAAFDKAAMDETNSLVEKYLAEQAAGGAHRGKAPLVPLVAPESITIPTRLEELEGEYRRLQAALQGAISDHHWASVDKISARKARVFADLEAERAKAPASQMSPEEAESSLREEVRQSPMGVHYKIFRDLLLLHPTWGQQEEEEEE